MNDYGKPPDDKTQQDDQAHELIEQLNLLEDVDRRITPEHVAKRFRELLDDIGDGGPPSSAAGRLPRGIPDQPDCGHQLTDPWRRYCAEPWTDPFGLTGSLEAAVAAARSAAADIIADTGLKAKAVSDELRRAQEAAAAARQEAEQFVADARAEADMALERAVKMIRDAGDQAKQILDDARNEAEQIVAAARNQQVHQATWTGHRFEAFTDAPEVLQPTPGGTYLPPIQTLMGMLATLTADQCWADRASRYKVHPVLRDYLRDSTPVFLAACGSQEPPGFLATALEQLAGMSLASMSTVDAISAHQGALALYQAKVRGSSMGEAVRAGGIAALNRKLNPRPRTTYQDTRLAGAGGVGSAAWLWKLATVPGDLGGLLARYGDLDECALADTMRRVWDLAGPATPRMLAGLGGRVYAVEGTVQVRDLPAGYGDLDALLARHLRHMGQDAPVDAAGSCLPCAARDGEGGASSGQAEAAECSHVP